MAVTNSCLCCAGPCPCPSTNCCSNFSMGPNCVCSGCGWRCFHGYRNGNACGYFSGCRAGVGGCKPANCAISGQCTPYTGPVI